ncbi:uncharacterized protein LOC117587955 [Drosophila guanche]|uniref:Blast:Histone-lysine N-methyltransferase 2D n=1 Tax=Drosophila guanche TaxID=7266 RepID=A0A3B0KJS4_DROGU|nr:uncharacterized protein LOC117587955 [Drosophila guanche]XP_034134850.1 uncharacterized protein LOC117587955 [Drosophila guanche]SPP86006.1 blast:Histone-lysine N-methyltransferase 2D [Drosophila guanche]
MAVSNHRITLSSEEYESDVHTLRTIKTFDDLYKTYRPTLVPPKPKKKPTSILRKRQTEGFRNQNDGKETECHQNDCQASKWNPCDVTTLIGPSNSILNLTLSQEEGTTTTIKAREQNNLEHAKSVGSSSSLQYDQPNPRIASGRNPFSKYSNSLCKFNKCKSGCRQEKAYVNCAEYSYVEPEPEQNRLYSEPEQNQSYPESQQTPVDAETRETAVYPDAETREAPVFTETREVYPETQENQVYTEPRESQDYPEPRRASQDYPEPRHSPVYPQPRENPVYPMPRETRRLSEANPSYGGLPKLQQNPVYSQQNPNYSESQQSLDFAESDRKTNHYNEHNNLTIVTSNGTEYRNESFVKMQSYDPYTLYCRCSKCPNPKDLQFDPYRNYDEASNADVAAARFANAEPKAGTAMSRSEESLAEEQPACQPYYYFYPPMTTSDPMDGNTSPEDATRSVSRPKTKGMKRPSNIQTGSIISGLQSAAANPAVEAGNYNQNQNAGVNCVDVESFLANCKKCAVTCCDPRQGCCPLYTPARMGCCPSPPKAAACNTNECYCMGYVHDSLQDRSVYAADYRPVMCGGNNFQHFANGISCLCADLPVGGGCGPCSNNCAFGCSFSTEPPSCCVSHQPACGPTCQSCCLYPLAQLSPGYCNSYPCGRYNTFCM